MITAYEDAMDVPGDFIEKLICEKLHKSKRPELEEEMMVILLQMQNAPNFVIDDEARKMHHVFGLAELRLALFQFKLESDRCLAIIIFAALSPGNIVMYLWYLQYWCKMNNKEVITWDDLMLRIFGNGFFDSKLLDDLWNTTKVQTSSGIKNLCDIGAAGRSLTW